MKEITIKVSEDVVSDLADVLCWMSGFSNAKGEDWKSAWLLDSLKGVRDLKIEIQNKL
jgi:hypothetical protein